MTDEFAGAENDGQNRQYNVSCSR